MAIEAPSPLCVFMEQLGKSMGSIEIVIDNAPSHSPIPIIPKTTESSLQDTNNRWDAVYHSKACVMGYCQPFNSCFRSETSPGRAQRRWSTCSDNSSTSLTLTDCTKRRSGGSFHKGSPHRPRRNSAEDRLPSTAINPFSTSTSKDDCKPRKPLHRSWSSPSVSTHAPTFVRPHSE